MSNSRQHNASLSNDLLEKAWRLFAPDTSIKRLIIPYGKAGKLTKRLGTFSRKQNKAARTALLQFDSNTKWYGIGETQRARAEISDFNGEVLGVSPEHHVDLLAFSHQLLMLLGRPHPATDIIRGWDAMLRGELVAIVPAKQLSAPSVTPDEFRLQALLSDSKTKSELVMADESTWLIRLTKPAPSVDDLMAYRARVTTQELALCETLAAPCVDQCLPPHLIRTAVHNYQRAICATLNASLAHQLAASYWGALESEGIADHGNAVSASEYVSGALAAYYSEGDDVALQDAAWEQLITVFANVSGKDTHALRELRDTYAFTPSTIYFVFQRGLL